MEIYMDFISPWITSKDFEGLTFIDNYHKAREKSQSEMPQHPNENYHCIFFSEFLCGRGEKYTLKISADDCYKLYINDSYVCQGPAVAYPWAYSYNELDVSRYLTEGRCRIAVHVYYQGLENRAHNSRDNHMGLICDLFCDGKFIFGTSKYWQYYKADEYQSGGIIGYSTQFLENLDFTKKMSVSEAIKHGATFPACELYEHGHIFKNQPDVVLQEERMVPKKIIPTPEGYHIEIPTIVVGHFYAVAYGERGEQIIVLCGEETEKDNEQKTRYAMRNGCTYKEICTLSGGRDELDFYDYKGFRFVDLVCKKESVDPDSFCAIVQHYPFDDSCGRLKTNDETLRKIWDLCRNTAKYATQSGFLDCPTREKGQYLGDFTVSGLAHLYLTGDCALYLKALCNFAESARICPGLMAVAPGAYMQEIADFSLQYPLQVLNYYNYSGDMDSLRSLFPVLEGLIGHFSEFARRDGLLVGVNDKWNIVDWPQNLRDGYDCTLNDPIDSGTLHNVINAHWAGANIVYEQIADILGADIERKADGIIKAFNSEFFDDTVGLFCDRPLSEYKAENKAPHYALHSNVLPEFYRFAPDKANKGISELIEKKGLSCGVQFSYFVLKACANMGRYDLEYKLLVNEGEHSWMNMLREGATTLFEAWGKDQKWNTSLCHPWASAPVIAIYEDIRHHTPKNVHIELYNDET